MFKLFSLSLPKRNNSKSGVSVQALLFSSLPSPLRFVRAFNFFLARIIQRPILLTRAITRSWQLMSLEKQKLHTEI